MHIGINGFGRIGRLFTRAVLSKPQFGRQIKIRRLNDVAGDTATHAHLLEFDSIHGRFNCAVQHNGNELSIPGHSAGEQIKCSASPTITDADWSDCDIVIEASGKYKSVDSLNAYFDQGVKRVIVCAPIKEPGALNIVMGVNQHLFDPKHHKIVTAASCTTNCIAPAVKVIHENFGIQHGSFTTIHNITNTQSILDTAHKDLRRARACGESLIPTTTGSASAITEIFPELRGRLNGHAVRVPLANASLTDCVFELSDPTSTEAVNAALLYASQTSLNSILGYEDRPLVSVDYRTNPHSCVVDALSTMVINGTHLKLYLWYDNEWGYANRVADLLEFVTQKVAR